MSPSSPSNQPRRPGRPREESTEQAITAAARQVVADRGVARMSMEHVAAEAGVAKSTLYRRWPSKVELAVHAVAATFDEIEVGDLGSLAADLRSSIGEAARLLRDPATGGAYAALLAESARDPEGVGRQVRESLSTRLHADVVYARVHRAADAAGHAARSGPGAPTSDPTGSTRPVESDPVRSEPVGSGPVGSGPA